MDNRLKKMQYRINGLPTAWVGQSFNNVGVSTTRSAKIMSAFRNLPERPVSIFVSGTVAPVVDFVVSEFGVNEVSGVNYVEFYNAKLGKSEISTTPAYKKFVVVYGVGQEPAVNNYTFTAKTLEALLADLKSKGCHVIVQLSVSVSQFEKTYNINTTNSVAIADKIEEKIL